MHNTKISYEGLSLLIAAVLCTVALALSACGGGSDPLNLKADTFQGGSLSNFSGPDGENTDDRDIAREMAVGRNYDFTPSGFNIASGPVSSNNDGSPFGIGSGNLAVSGDEATVDLDITSTNPDVINPHMQGNFSLAQAGAAIVNPSSSFDVAWIITFTTIGDIPVELHTTQTLTGTDFVAP